MHVFAEWFVFDGDDWDMCYERGSHDLCHSDTLPGQYTSFDAEAVAKPGTSKQMAKR
jgi:hypothetical protein